LRPVIWDGTRDRHDELTHAPDRLAAL
jgi:hypothetical protein